MPFSTISPTSSGCQLIWFSTAMVSSEKLKPRGGAAGAVWLVSVVKRAGRVFSHSPMLVRTPPGQKAETPIGSSISSKCSASDRPTTANLVVT